MKRLFLTIMILLLMAGLAPAADTARNQTDILALFADGQPAGSISPQDMRDYIVSILPATKTEGRLLRFGASEAVGQSTGIYEDGSGNIGIGVTDPDAALEVYKTTLQLKLSYDADSFAGFTVDASDDLTVKPAATGGIRFQPTTTDSTDFFQILDQDGGDSPIFNIDSTNERVGIGTPDPAEALHVTSGNIEVSDPADLGSESLTDYNDFTDDADWDYTGEAAASGTNAVYTYAASGNGTITQTNGAMAAAGVNYRWYKLSYTISSSTVAGATVTVTNAFASVATALDVTDGGHIVFLQAKSSASTADFVINITGATSGAFTLESMSVKEIQGGDVIAGGIFSGGGSSGIKILANGRVGFGGVLDPYSAVDLEGTITFSKNDDAQGIQAYTGSAYKILSLDASQFLMKVSGAEGARLATGGLFLIGTTDFDGTPAVGRTVIKGSTADGTTNILVGRDSGEANVYIVNTDGLLDTYNAQVTVGVGQPYILGNVATTGATALVGATNIVASAAAGLYRVTGYMQTTTAADGACSSDVTVGWTYNSSAKSLAVVSNHDQAVDETYSQIPPTIVRVDGAANLTYAISLDVDADCTNATFDYYLTAERIQ